MPYIYRVENLVTGQFYYGARYVETTTPELDLWLKYFTSSKDVKHLIEQHGIQSFTNLILETYTDPDICYQHEQVFIKENINHPLCLNKQYTECGEKVFLNKGHTEETKAKMSAANKGRTPSNKGKPAYNKGLPMSEEQKAKLAIANKGKKRTTEQKEMLSKIHTARYALIRALQSTDF